MNFFFLLIFTNSVCFKSIEGEYIPRVGDKVSYRLVLTPPKFDKQQAVHVRITDFTPEAHQRWQSPLTDEEEREGSRPGTPLHGDKACS